MIVRPIPSGLQLITQPDHAQLARRSRASRGRRRSSLTHAWFVYERFRTSADPEWAAFFAEMAAARDARLEALRLPFDELESDYAFLRLGDLISLAFCTQAPEPSRYGRWTVQADGARVVVGSAPFSGAVPFEVQAREIHAGPFRSDDELRAAVGAAVTTTLRGEVVRSPG